MTAAPSAHTSAPWHLLGTGSLACLWAANLHRAGIDVHLIARNAERLKAYHGITLESADASEHFDIAAETASQASPISRLLVCTKAYDACMAVQSVVPRMLPDAAVVLLQNGMGFQDRVNGLLGHCRVYCAITTEGAWRPGPFHVIHAGRGATLVGRYARAAHDDATALAAELNASGLPVQPSVDIHSELWRKLAISCVINALTAIHGCANGELLSNPDYRRECERLCEEIRAVLRALQMEPLATTLWDAVEKVVRATAANQSSMRQDIVAGKRSEIDFINAYLCQRATELAIPVPLNRALCERIKVLETP